MSREVVGQDRNREVLDSEKHEQYSLSLWPPAILSGYK